MSGPKSKRTDVSAILRLCRWDFKPDVKACGCSPAGATIEIGGRLAPPPLSHHPACLLGTGRFRWTSISPAGFPPAQAACPFRSRNHLRRLAWGSSAYRLAAFTEVKPSQARWLPLRDHRFIPVALARCPPVRAFIEPPSFYYYALG
jgi:hypothetical protein